MQNVEISDMVFILRSLDDLRFIYPTHRIQRDLQEANWGQNGWLCYFLQICTF